MVMEMRNPMVLLVGLALTAFLVAGFHALHGTAKGKYSGGIKAANTKFAKALPEYAARRRRWKAAMALLEACVIAGLVACSVVAARPSRMYVEEGDARKRDIFLCLDVSYSIFAQNGKLVESLKDLVKGLNGERFGISIFNCTSVIYVPMTDDYEYILSELDTLKQYFDMQVVEIHEMYGDPAYGWLYDEDFMEKVPEPDPELVAIYENEPEKWKEMLSEVEAGVSAGSFRGSSLIGEGLATCLYSFPHLEDEERTRVIIFSTDNDPAALQEDVDFKGAGDLCKKHDVTVYGVFPSEDDLPGGHSGDYGKAETEFDNICSATGGKLYVAGSGKMDVNDAVTDIRSREAMTTFEPAHRQRIDMPEVPMAALAVISLLLMLTVAVMRPW